MKRILILLLINYIAIASEMDDAYQEAISSGSSYNTNTLKQIQKTDVSDIETDLDEVDYRIKMGDETSSKKFALSHQEVKDQYGAAQQTIAIRESADNNMVAQAEGIVNNPDQYISNDDYCTQGDCHEIETADHTDDMVKSAAVLDDVLGGGSSYADSGSQARIYTGKAEKCKQDNWGFADCCAEEGWGVDWNLTNCPAETKKLGEKKERGLCHLIGKYEQKIRKLGVVVRVDEYKGYCCFSSEMAKLTHEGGRPQVKMNWGSPKYPNCQGFTANQFAKLDFSKIKLDPVYDDIIKNSKPIDTNNMINEPNEYYQEHGIESW